MRSGHRLKFLTFSIFLGTLGSILILPSSGETIPSNGNMTSQTSSLSGFQETCSTWIGIAPDETSENNTDISCLQKVLGKCQFFNVTLGYALGSMRISIKGLTNEGACSVNLIHEIEMGENNMTCIIPQDRMSTWTNWKRGDGLDAVDQVAKYCSALS